MSIEHLRKMQSTGAVDLISTLSTVEINITDICNRECSFCPQSLDDYSYKSSIKLDIIEKIAFDLSAIDYNGRVSFVGFGEPLLYKNLHKAVDIINRIVKNVKWIEINTNADYLTRDKAEVLALSGCTNLTVSMYDYDISSKITSLLAGIEIELTFKHCYAILPVVNRNDIISQETVLNINRQCFLPFYKMLIDSTGDVLICNNDWGRNGVIGSIKEQSIQEIWFSEKISNYRNELKNGNRNKCDPCKYCNINGKQYGKDSYDIWINA